MKAKYPGTCQYCHEPIAIGDEITRGNGDRRHRGYGHARCVPSAGTLRPARWIVEILESENARDLPVGFRRQFVHQSKAQSEAILLRGMRGVKRVEVRAV